MNATQNPYAPPQSFDKSGISPAVTATGIWRDDKDLIIVHDVALPARCVKCNVPAEPRSKPMKVWSHHAGYYLLILVNPLIYVIVGLIVRKSAKVSPALCDVHKKRRSNGIWIGWLGAIASFAIWVGGNAVNQAALSLLGFVTMVVCIVVGIIMSRIVSAKGIDEIYVRMRGCGQDFLDSLPRFPG